MGFFIPKHSMQNKNTSIGLKNWPCNLEKIHEDATRIVYVDAFNGSKIFIHVQRGVKIYIEVPAGIEKGNIINDYIKTVCKPSIFNNNGDKVCRWRFGDDQVIFRLGESGDMYVTSNKIELVNLYCEPDNVKRVKDFLNRY